MFTPFLSGIGAIQADGSGYSMQKVETESQGMGLLSLDLSRLSLLPAGAYIMGGDLNIQKTTVVMGQPPRARWKSAGEVASPQMEDKEERGQYPSG